MPATHTYSITSTGPSIPADTQVVGFRGEEGISRPYRIEVFFLVAEAELASFSPAALLGARAALSIHHADGEVRRTFCGAWSSVSLVRAVSGGRALYRGVLSPALWRLSLTERSRIFVHQTLPDIVEAVLHGAGFGAEDFTFELENRDRYLALDHVCQYRESDLDFLARRLEHDGLYYFFRHAADGKAETLVITDSLSFLDAYDPSPVYFLEDELDDAGNIPDAEEGLSAISCEYRATSAGAQVYGYNPLAPAAVLFGEAPNGLTRDLQRSWTLARTPAESTDDSERLAVVRAGEIAARATVVEARGRVFTAAAGFRLTVADHALLDGDYLVTALSFRGCDFTANEALTRALGFGREVFEVTLEAIPATTQFRPARVTPRPRVHGFELGVVRGPVESDYAQLDEHGRYLVRLMFEGVDPGARAPSTRLRMLQPHGGASGEGFHFPLRNGTEVLVSFVGGDPDAPVIAGVAPNPQTASPVTSDNHTQNVLQTGGGSRLQIEDLAEAQAVDWTTPYANTSFHLGKSTRATEYEVETRSDGSGHVQVAGSWDTDVGGNHRTTVAGSQGESVTGNVTRSYGANIDDTITGTWTVNTGVADFTAGTASGLVTGNEANLNAGAKFDLYMGEQFAIGLGLKQEIFLGGTLSVLVGPKVEAHAGLKVDAHAGVKVESTGLEVKWEDLFFLNPGLLLIL